MKPSEQVMLYHKKGEILLDQNAPFRLHLKSAMVFQCIVTLLHSLFSGILMLCLIIQKPRSQVYSINRTKLQQPFIADNINSNIKNNKGNEVNLFILNISSNVRKKRNNSIIIMYFISEIIL